MDVAANDAEAHMVALQAQPLAISLDASEFHAYHSGVMDFEDCGSDLNHAVRAFFVSWWCGVQGVGRWLTD